MSWFAEYVLPLLIITLFVMFLYHKRMAKVEKGQGGWPKSFYQRYKDMFLRG